MELLVFRPKLFLFESLNLNLLLKQTTFNLNHVFVVLEHLREKIVGSSNRDACLQKESQTFDYVIARVVVALNS